MRGLLLHGAHDAVLDGAGDLGIRLVVDARDLLIPLRDDPHLGRRRARRVADERRRDPGLVAGARERRRRVVLSGDGDERRLAAERRHVVRDVRGAANPVRLVIEGDDRNRRLGRDARHAPDDELVEHGVADDEDVRAGECRRDPAARGQARSAAGAPSVRSAANGSVTSTRKSIRNSESPKLYSNMPGREHRHDRGERRWRRARAP